jgi:hypothetical protein
MKDNTLGSLGGLCSILLGVSYILVAAIFLLLPADQRAGADELAYYTSIAQSPDLVNAYYLVFALSGILGLGAVPAISERVRRMGEGWVRWGTNLALLGFSVTAINFFRFWSVQASRAEAYVAGDASTRAAMDASYLSLDPQGWLGFGAIGAWVLIVSVLALRGSAWSRSLSYVGIALTAMYWLIVISFVFDIGALRTIVAALGGVVLAPIWFIWVGLRLRQVEQLQQAQALTPVE